ncbi:M20 aminoacylase family protein [Photobacterium damselae]|uniref:Amidohydrolase n=1 Tax=Photobacterium damselae subsp. damselae TaxID=85581 RepID=A0AAD3ZTW1_PHODD|nr:M20 aminoacylase family protein [Photobacterium damselae]KAB1174217.1 amidohydrolase [Photobacterium damselae subsp. damselae]KAB1180410.1 amidohydrolase [Photobacterium damselae subsp. damselae]MBF7099727.1 amidohydrolase [Photobacterium damselae]NVO72473.1 amidohydrolase [Photobacterium damselae subsp. damselae]QSH58530.1 amidohydrolase [Photobacterium damselae subsp. damselae]
MTIKNIVTEWRHHIHKHPEFGFEEEMTSAFVAQKLEEFGLEVHKNIGKTGVVGILKCGNSERSIGLRADMDALHICEKNTFAHASVHDGVMHACGHDGHTAMLLGAAYQLSQSKHFDGTVYFIFQPGEEHGVGAKAMIADGLFTRWNIDAVYAMHNLPGIPEGHFVTRPHSIMASESSFEIEVIATGGHAAMPHMGTDPIVVGSQIVLALQTIVSRHLSAIDETAVISVTEFATNGTVNVIPSRVTIKGDTRSFTDQALHKIEKAIERIVAGQCMAAGVDYKYNFNNSFLSTINTPEETDHAVKAALAVAGEDKVNGSCQPFTISEDFSFMLREAKGCYILVGNGVGECGGTALHNPHYDFNDNILMSGVNFWQTLVEQQLNQ